MHVAYIQDNYYFLSLSECDGLYNLSAHIHVHMMYSGTCNQCAVLFADLTSASLHGDFIGKYTTPAGLTVRGFMKYSISYAKNLYPFTCICTYIACMCSGPSF